MKSFKKYAVLAALGIIIFASIMICYDRWKRENRSDHVTLAVSFSEVRGFALQWGRDPFDLLAAMQKHGLDMVLVEEITLANLQESSRAVVIEGNELIKLKSFCEVPFAFSQDNTYVLCSDSNAADSVEAGLASRFGRTRVARGILNDKYIIEIAGRDIKNKYVFASGLEKTFDELILNTPLCVDQELAEKLKKMGFELVFNFKSSEFTHSSSVNLLFQGVEKFNHAGVILFSGDRITGYPDYSYKTAQFISRLQRSRKDLRVGILEFHKPLGLQDLIKEIDPAGFVRVHTITPEEMIKIPFKKAMDRWIRAVRERNLKILFLRPFQTGRTIAGRGYVSSPLELNLMYIKMLRQRIIKAGFRPGTHESRFIAGSSRVNIFFISLCVTGFTLALAGIFFNLSLNWFVRIMLIVQLPCLIFLVTAENIVIYRQFFAFLSALVFPSLAGIHALRHLSREWKGLSWCFSSAFWAGFRGAVFVLTGIIFITALLYETSFMLKIQQFKGVKAAFLLPLAITVLYFLKSNRIDFSFLNRPLTLLHLMLGLGLLGILGIYILRSGNLPGRLPGASNSGIESSVRDMLEQTLVARPRTKEFLIGYPSLFILGFLVSSAGLLKKDLTLFKLFSLLGLEILFISTTNTFCHIHSPLQISVLRTGNAALIGIPAGIIAMFAAHFLFTYLRCRKKILLCGYYGYGNTGDEAVLQRIQKILQTADKEYVVCTSGPVSLENGQSRINRFDPIALCAALLSSRKVVLGGGSLIQDKTGLLSPVYYLGIGLAANIAGRKLIVFANGLGPLKNTLVRKLTGLVFSSAQAVSFRDSESLELGKSVIKEAGLKKDISALTTVCDPVLNWPADSGESHDKPDFFKGNPGYYTIAVVLRSWPGFKPVDAADALKKFLQENKKKIIEKYKGIRICVPVFKEDDNQVSKALVDALGNLEKEVGKTDLGTEIKLLSIESPAIAFDLIKCSNCVLAMRLHAAVFAAAAGTPFTTIDYDPKVSSFSFQFFNSKGIEINQNLMENCCLRLTDLFFNNQEIRDKIVFQKHIIQIDSADKFLLKAIS